MDILKILQESEGELLPEDLDLFETELDTGEGYDADYREQCREKIRELRGRVGRKAAPPRREAARSGPKSAPASGRLVLGIHDLAPQEANPVGASITPARQAEMEIAAMREEDDYKKVFKGYVKNSTVIDAAFVEARFSFFSPWEMGVVLSEKQMGEEFLEKYFGALDHGKIARYQCFSESFFMKHFAQLDASAVLTRGKNEWRKKENRSKQLDVFLRLKGIKL